MKEVKEWEELCEERREIEKLDQACDMVYSGLDANYGQIIVIDPWLDSKLNVLNEIKSYLKRRDDDVRRAINALR